MRPFDALRARRVLEINARYQAHIEPGFPIVLEGNAETLQIARQIDATNWLIVLGICNEAEALGAGDQMLPAPGLRCTSNRNYLVSYSAAGQIVRDLRAYGLAAWANRTRLADLARDCPTRQGLDLIDLEEGWP